MTNISPSGSGASPAPPKRPVRLPVGIGYALVAIVGATCLLVSAYYLWRLALLTGMPTWLAWSLPVALDVAAAGAAFYWVTGRKATRKWGRGIALSALAGTLAGNALSHLITFGLMKVSPWLVIGLGTVYPAAAWGMIHLVLVYRAEQASRATSTKPRSPRKPASKPRSRRKKATPAERRQWINDQIDAGVDVTGPDVEKQFGTTGGCRDVGAVKAQRKDQG